MQTGNSRFARAAGWTSEVRQRPAAARLSSECKPATAGLRGRRDGLLRSALREREIWNGRAQVRPFSCFSPRGADVVRGGWIGSMPEPSRRTDRYSSLWECRRRFGMLGHALLLRHAVACLEFPCGVSDRPEWEYKKERQPILRSGSPAFQTLMIGGARCLFGPFHARRFGVLSFRRLRAQPFFSFWRPSGRSPHRRRLLRLRRLLRQLPMRPLRSRPQPLRP